MLKADSQGFLQGEATDIGKKSLTAITDVRADVRAIKRAILGGKVSAPGGASTAKVAQSAPTAATPRDRAASAPRDAKGRFVKSESKSQVAQPAARGAVAATQSRAATAESNGTPTTKSQGGASAAVSERDKKGRFANGKEGAPAEEPKDAGGSSGNGFFARLTGAVRDGMSGSGEVDPNVQAMQEVAQPMMRGAQVMFGGDKDKKKIGFLRNIYLTLTGKRKDDAKANKETNQTLKAIKEKRGEGGGGGGILASILAAIIAIPGALMAMLMKIPFLGKMLKGGVGLGGAFGGGGAAAGKGLKGLLRRIPILGALLGGLGVAADIYGSETDGDLTRRQKDKNAGKSVGGLAGMLGGAAAGAALGSLLGPVGTVIGGIAGGLLGDQAGQIIGEEIGGWVTDLREADIPGQIAMAWEDATKAVKSGWATTMRAAESLWNDIRSMAESTWIKTKQVAVGVTKQAVKVANDANATVKEKTGVDVKENLKTSAKAVKETATAVADKAVEVGSNVAEKAKQGAQWAGENTTPGRAAVKAWKGARDLASMIAGGESGKAGYDAYNRGTGLGSTGHRDISGMTLDEIKRYQALDKSDKNRLMAVGKYQMMPSTLAEGAKALGLSGDTKFDAATQERLYTDYLVGVKRPQIKDYITGKRADPKAAQIAMAQEWRSIADPRTGATYADKGSVGNKASVSADAALGAMDDARRRYQMNMAKGMAEIDAYRDAVSSMKNVTAPTQQMATTEASVITNAAPSLANAPVATNATVLPSMSRDKVTSLMPTLAALNAAPKIPEPIGQSKGPLQVQVANANDVKQDIGDRHLSHVVTGGMSRV